jgi:hypothetical protein
VYLRALHKGDIDDDDDDNNNNNTSFSSMSSQWMLNSGDSQNAYAIFCIIHTEL